MFSTLAYRQVTTFIHLVLKWILNCFIDTKYFGKKFAFICPPKKVLHPQKPISQQISCSPIFCRNLISFMLILGVWWRNWLRHCVTRWQVTGSIPNGVNGIFHRLNPSSRAMVLGSTQFLTEMSTRNISWQVKAAGA